MKLIQVPGLYFSMLFLTKLERNLIVHDVKHHVKHEAFLLRIPSGNVNASVVTCQYPQIY